jgi:hypothetical protein
MDWVGVISCEVPLPALSTFRNKVEQGHATEHVTTIYQFTGVKY